jgi:hypothetical protein
VERREPLRAVEKFNLAQCFWKILWSFLLKLKTELPYELAIPFLSTYPKEMKLVSQIHLYSHVHCSTIHSSQDKENPIRTYNGMLFSHKKETLFATTEMNLEGIC